MDSHSKTKKKACVYMYTFQWTGFPVKTTKQKEMFFINNNEPSSVPVWEKMALTLSEAAELYGIGINKLRDISNSEDCPFVLYVGRKRLIKRKQFDTFLANAYSV